MVETGQLDNVAKMEKAYRDGITNIEHRYIRPPVKIKAKVNRRKV